MTPLMRITDISLQAKNKNRVNVSVDGKYRFSLDIYQVSELGIKVGNDYDEADLAKFETESQFGKLYARALDYCLLRPHSHQEIRDYLRRQTVDRRRPDGTIRPGVTPEMARRVEQRLAQKGCLDDTKFAHFWIENHHSKRGASRRQLTVELRSKGVDQAIIEAALVESPRDEIAELRKVIARKKLRYPDKQKLIAYLVRQGFLYDNIKDVLAES